jgi:ribonucleoside-triphosphate reductase
MIDLFYYYNKGFGGVSSGPEPLKELHENIRRILGGTPGKLLTSTMIVDLMNYIGKCVVSGNVRQTAEIAFGSPNDKAFLDLKNYEVNPHRAEYGWTSNNSVPFFFFFLLVSLFFFFANTPNKR